MKDRKLLRELNKLGFILFEKEESIDINKTLYDVIMSKEIRLLEGFPVIFANAMEVGGFDYRVVMDRFKTQKERSTFLNFLILSLALYKYNKLEFRWEKDLLKSLSKNEKEKINTFLLYLKDNSPFRISQYSLNPERLKNIFINYYESEKVKTKEVIDRQEELSLEYALSQIFSPKQKNLFRKKLKGEKMTKTDKEYFSRVVKKKVMALSNQELHNMARKILEL